MKNRETTPRPFEFEADGKFEMFGRRDAQGNRQVRRLEFTTKDKLGHGVSRACSRRECWQIAMSIRAVKLREQEAGDAKLAAEVDAGIARHANACPKSPETPAPIWALRQPGVLNAVLEALEGMGFSVSRSRDTHDDTHDKNAAWLDENAGFVGGAT